jgi:hypothetical protein
MVVMEPPEVESAHDVPSGMGAGRRRAFGRRGSDEPFVVLVGEEPPPGGIQATEGLWGLVTLGGAPVAFISPDVVVSLDPDLPVADIFDDLSSAYVAELARRPRNFFQAQLAGDVEGRVFILDYRYAGEAGRNIRVIALEDAQCDQGQILPIGKTCPGCQCSRRRQR